MKEKVLELMQLALEYNAPDFHVVTTCFGHCDMVHMSIYVGGFRDEEPTVQDIGFFDDELSKSEGIDTLIKLLKDTHAKHGAEAA